MGRPKQQEIKQFEQQRIGAIENAADKYVEKRDLRIGIQREEIETRDKLTRLMHENVEKIDHQDGVLAYTRSDYKIVVETKEKIKVRIGEEPTDDDDEGDLP